MIQDEYPPWDRGHNQTEPTPAAGLALAAKSHCEDFALELVVILPDHPHVEYAVPKVIRLLREYANRAEHEHTHNPLAGVYTSAEGGMDIQGLGQVRWTRVRGPRRG